MSINPLEFKHARESANLTLAQAADILETCERTIRRYEDGESKIPPANLSVLKTFSQLSSKPVSNTNTFTFIDLFAGMGGTRIGFEAALKKSGIKGNCVFTSEIKKFAINAYQTNFDANDIHGDITKISPSDLPDFNFLLAGFPCQPFSSAGKRQGFMDERGGLFFTIYKILKSKQPDGFLLENVDALISHDNGNTISIIISKLKSLGYYVDYKLLNSKDFGIPQVRKRVYIIGHKCARPIFFEFEKKHVTAGNFIDYKEPFDETPFSKILTSRFSKDYLEGKSIKDKRGGKNNIHSWDIDLKGKVTTRQKNLLVDILKKRRYKKWAQLKGIEWMDGMPLTTDEIRTFQPYDGLQDDLDYLEKCGYLKFEHPKDIVSENGIKKRVYKTTAKKGYNIVAGKLSYPIAKILHPNDFVPTIVATEVGKIAVATEKGIRSILVKEGLRFSGFPNWYNLNIVDYKEAFDLLGNTVMPPVIEYVSEVMIKAHKQSNDS